MPRPDDVRLRDMLDTARRALRHASGRTRAELDSDELLVDALVRTVEVIGEAARHVSEASRARAPDIPWRQVVGMRDRLAHGYFEVNLNILWDVLTGDLPPLVAALEKVVAPPA